MAKLLGKPKNRLGIDTRVHTEPQLNLAGRLVVFGDHEEVSPQPDPHH